MWEKARIMQSWLVEDQILNNRKQLMQPLNVPRNGDINKEAVPIFTPSAQPLVFSNTSSLLDWSKAKGFAELNSIAIF